MNIRKLEQYLKSIYASSGNDKELLIKKDWFVVLLESKYKCKTIIIINKIEGMKFSQERFTAPAWKKAKEILKEYFETKKNNSV